MSLSTSQTQLKNFLPLAKLGQGTFSTVYKVKRIQDGEIYALKKIKMQKLNQKQQQNALNEIRILASLKSNFIVSYKQAFYDQPLNLLCIVMQFADGGDLQKFISDHIKAKSKILEDEIRKAASQILLGLYILHEKGILHRDLKSANVFISNKNYKLGDLNVSKICSNQMAKTQTGTPYYTSPEVWRDEVYDSKCDVWSLGCLLYQMCSLMPPFQGCDLDDLFRAVQKGQYRPIPSDYSTELAKLIQCCLTVNPKQRLSVKQLINQFPFLNRRFSENLMKQQVQLNIPFLSTIRLPYDLKDLTKNLPLPDYDVSLKQCPKTVYELGNKEAVIEKNKNELQREKISPLPQRIKKYFMDQKVSLQKRPERPYTSSKRPQKIELKHELRPVSAVHCRSQKVNLPSNFSRKLKIVTGSQQVQAIRANQNITKQKAFSIEQTFRIQSRHQSSSPINKLPVSKPTPITLRSASKNHSQRIIYEQKLQNINPSLKDILSLNPLNEKAYIQCKENSIKRISSLERKVQHIREERKERRNVLERNKENTTVMRQERREENLDMKERLKQKIKQSSEVFSLKRHQKQAQQFIPPDFHINNQNGGYLKVLRPENSGQIERHFNNKLKNLYSGRHIVSADSKRDRNQFSLIQNKNHKQNQRKFGMIRQIPTNIFPSIVSEKKPLKNDFDSQIYTKAFNRNIKAHQSIQQSSLVDNSEAIIRLKKRIKNRMICQSNRNFEVQESLSRNAPPINRFYY